MICGRYKNALLELAAAGAEANPQLHAHLQGCPSCRSAFENERSLFASIDSCLRSSANVELPPSFIPTVRAQLWRESPLVRGNETVTNRLLWVPSLVAATIILFIFVRLDRRAKLLTANEQFATQRAPSPVTRPTTPVKPLQDPIPQITPAIGKSTAAKAVTTHEKKPPQIERHGPEIIVPPDQEILLARYVDQWRRQHQPASTLLTEADPDQTAPLQVPLIQIAELDVKPLAPLADDQEFDQKNDRREK
jgi:hypothetical protein